MYSVIIHKNICLKAKTPFLVYSQDVNKPLNFRWFHQCCAISVPSLWVQRFFVFKSFSWNCQKNIVGHNKRRKSRMLVKRTEKNHRRAAKTICSIVQFRKKVTWPSSWNLQNEFLYLLSSRFFKSISRKRDRDYHLGRWMPRLKKNIMLVCLWTHPSALDKLILSGLHIFLLASPCSQNWSLQCTSIWECQSPWALWYIIDSAQIDWSFFFRLSTWQESDSCEKIKFI